MKIIIITFVLFFTSISFSQTVADSLLKPGWNPNGVVGLNLSQIAFSNWTQGGSNSLAFTFYSNFGAVYFSYPWKWKSYLKSAFGRTKLEDAGYRTTDNEIYFETLLSRDINWAVDPYFAVTIRSAVTKGYDYTVTPSVQIVDFFDPGYVTESLGFLYTEGSVFSTRLGIAIQQTFAKNFTVYTDDIETSNKIEDFKFDTGLESVSELKYDFATNMSYSSFLRLFSRFNQLEVWDVRWDNNIAAKVNDYISVNFNVVLVHEISQSRKTQLKEALQLGIIYTIF